MNAVALQSRSWPQNEAEARLMAIADRLEILADKVDTFLSHMEKNFEHFRA